MTEIYFTLDLRLRRQGPFLGPFLSSSSEDSIDQDQDQERDDDGGDPADGDGEEERERSTEPRKEASTSPKEIGIHPGFEPGFPTRAVKEGVSRSAAASLKQDQQHAGGNPGQKLDNSEAAVSRNPRSKLPIEERSRRGASVGLMSSEDEVDTRTAGGKVQRRGRRTAYEGNGKRRGRSPAVDSPDDE